MSQPTDAELDAALVALLLKRNEPHYCLRVIRAHLTALVHIIVRRVRTP